MNTPTSAKEAALAEYLDECSELIERFVRNLALLEAGQHTQETLGAIYRDVHTIKGTSQLFGFSQISQMAHAMETSLDPVRKNNAIASGPLIDCLYAGADFISSMLNSIKEHRRESDKSTDLSRLIPRLITLTEAALSFVAPLTKDKIPRDDTPQVSGYQHPQLAPASTTSREQTGPDLSAEVSKTPMSEVTARSLVDPPRTAQDDPPAETIRVHVALLDNLMNLVGELVLIRNQFLQFSKSNDEDGEFSKVSQRLNVLTAELQNEVMKSRMQPLGNILTKFNRLARDLGRELGKKIELELNGAETELDKTIIEAIKDPLTHIVRNSIDHGIETTEDRRSAQKPETGRIRIGAHHESGQVIIEISDDGRGLDRSKIGPKAVEKGLLSAESLAKMSDRDVQFLIFAPGFSTAATVSNISGRGVGMDVVRTNIERIGGTVDLISSPGSGTTIKLKIPLTLAIVPALIVRSDELRYAIPQAKLVELLRIDPDKSAENIEILQGRPVLRLRGNILPLVHLSEILKRPPSAATSAQEIRPGDDGACHSVVVLNADGNHFGLIVDHIEDSADIVVKSISQFLKDLAIFSGATILGDGAIALTLDVNGLAASAGVENQPRNSTASNKVIVGQEKSPYQSDMTEFLLVGVGGPGSYAIPLPIISRLEEFESSRIELSGEQRVIRYGETLLPLLSLPEFLKLPFPRPDGSCDRHSVVVVRRGSKLYGIEVDTIQDVVTLPSQVDQSVRDRPGILGTIVSSDKIFVVVDIFGIIDSLRSRLEGHPPAQGAGSLTDPARQVSERGRRSILVVEDSSFFRNYICQVLQDSGYHCDGVCDGAEALSVLENSPDNHFDLILSDIEMPIMDGITLAKKISSQERYRDLPMIAITTRYSSSDIEKGINAGFRKYLEKLNADALVSEIDTLLLAAGRPEGLKRVVNG